MKRIPSLSLALLTTLAGVLAGTSAPCAMCVPVCDDCQLRSGGQLNFVIMDREEGRIRLVPNIRLTGTADDFALVVPTPSLPTLEPAPVALWNEILSLTGPVWYQRGSDDGMGCGSPTSVSAEDPVDVRILVQERVGAFQVTIVAPDGGDPDALARWLVANGYAVSLADAALFGPYAERGWVFCAMKLDPGKTTIPERWDTNVDPVLFTYKAEELEIPLPMLRINRAPSLPVEFFVVDDHRMDISGFTTTYANRITGKELAAMGRYPLVVPYLAPGRVLTRLHRVFTSDTEMNESVFLGRAPEDIEYRRVIVSTAGGDFPARLLGLTGLMLLGQAACRRVKPRRSL